MLATDSVASAIPYDGFTVVAGRPYGANAVVNSSIEDMVTGSDPLSSVTTLLRSIDSPLGGRPRCAHSSNAKFGAAARVGPVADSSARRLIQRYGLRTNAIGSMSVMWLPHNAGNMIMMRPMS